jgi:hypothetical protein
MDNKIWAEMMAKIAPGSLTYMDFHSERCALVPESTLAEWQAERDALRAEVEALEDTLQTERNYCGTVVAENLALRAALEAAPPAPEPAVDRWYNEWFTTTRAEALRRESI